MKRNKILLTYSTQEEIDSLKKLDDMRGLVPRATYVKDIIKQYINKAR